MKRGKQKPSDSKTAIESTKTKKVETRGNPHLKKGTNNPTGEGGIVAPARKLRTYIAKCAEFMDDEGWDLLHNAARVHGSKNQIPALKMSAEYGFGCAPKSLDVTSGGKEIKSLADFLTMKAEPGESGAEGSGGD